MAAAVAGKHIHVEKPLTLDRPSAEAAVAAAKRAGIVLAVGFNRRFHPSVVEIRKRLADGQLGQVMSMVGDAHHLDRPVHRRRQLARAAGRGAGRRASPRSACIRSTT